MKVKPLKNYLLVKVIEDEEFAKKGIILTGSSKNESNLVKVIEVPDCIDDDRDIIMKGDKLLINPHIRINVKLDGEEYFILSQEDVFAVLE